MATASNSISKQQAAALILLFAAIACVEQARILSLLSTRYTHEDHGVLWTAAVDWASLQMREPTFYGQDYGVTFEAIPAAILHAFGVRYGSALPIGLSALGLFSAWVCAWGAWSRGWFVSAIGAAATPILVSTEHSVMVSIYGTGAGRFIAAVGAALLLGCGQRRRGALASVACCVLAVQFDPSSALLAAPTLVFGACTLWYRRAYWLSVLEGGLIALGWFGLRAIYNARHPDHVIHPGTVFQPDLQFLKHNLAHPQDLLSIHAPELAQTATFVFVAVGTLALIALVARAWAPLCAVACFIVLLALLASLWKSIDGLGTIWFRPARTTLMVPLAIWFLASVVLQAAGARARFMTQRLAWMIAGFIVLSTLSTSYVRAAGLQGKLEQLVKIGLAEGRYPIRTTDEVERICGDVVKAARDAGTGIVIFLNDDQSASFACHALYPELTTAFPAYERRWWVLHRLMTRNATRMILWSVKPKLCNRATWRASFTQCGDTSVHQGVAVAFEPKPPLLALHAIGFNPRPFGDDCSPPQRETCQFWKSHFIDP